MKNKIENIQKELITVIVKNTIKNKLEKFIITKNNINLDIAKMLMTKIEQKAKDINLPVVIAVSNYQGNIIAVHSMDDALIASYDIAVNKAYTVVVLKMTTEELGKLSQLGQPLYGIQTTNQGRIVNFGGGVPLIYKDKIIGGLGVSGGTVEQDTLMANYGAEILGQIIN